MQKVSSISCGARHSLAVTFSGEVFHKIIYRYLLGVMEIVVN